MIAHLLKLRNSYLPNPGNSQADERTNLVEGASHNEVLPRWCSLDLDKYIENRPWLAKCVVRGVPNRQQAHFWMDRHGPKYFIFLLQASCLCCFRPIANILVRVSTDTFLFPDTIPGQPYLCRYLRRPTLVGIHPLYLPRGASRCLCSLHDLGDHPLDWHFLQQERYCSHDGTSIFHWNISKGPNRS